jgi:hypothetical protein
MSAKYSKRYRAAVVLSTGEIQVLGSQSQLSDGGGSCSNPLDMAEDGRVRVAITMLDYVEGFGQEIYAMDSAVSSQQRSIRYEMNDDDPAVSCHYLQASSDNGTSSTTSRTSCGYNTDESYSEDNISKGNTKRDITNKVAEYSFQKGQVLPGIDNRVSVVSATEINGVDFWSIDGQNEESKNCSRTRRKKFILLAVVALCGVGVCLCIFFITYSNGNMQSSHDSAELVTSDPGPPSGDDIDDIFASPTSSPYPVASPTSFYFFPPSFTTPTSFPSAEFSR